MAKPTVLIDNEKVKVTEWYFAVGDSTGAHTHEYDYVITAVTDCAMLLENPDGAVVEVLIPAGTAYRRDAGVKHNVINRGADTMTFVEVELK